MEQSQKPSLPSTMKQQHSSPLLTWIDYTNTLITTKAFFVTLQISYLLLIDLYPMIKKCIILAICFIAIFSSFSPIGDIQIPPNTFQLEYSDDGTLIAAASPTTIYIFNGQSHQKIQQLTFSDPYAVSSLAFSQDSSYLAVGYKNGEGRIYKHENQKFNQVDKSFKSNRTSTVKSICFTSDNSYVIFGLQSNLIAAWSISSYQIAQNGFNNEFIFTVACSKTDPTLFVAGGGQNIASKFIFYKMQNNQVKILYDVPKGQQIFESTYGSAFSSDGSSVFRGQINGYIYKYDTQTYQSQTLNIAQLKDKRLSKIEISQGNKYIAISYPYPQSIAIATQAQGNRYSVQTFESFATTVSICLKNSKVVYVSATNKATILTPCGSHEYFDKQSQQCKQCNSECKTCEISAVTCTSCYEKYFLNNNQCLRCTVGCINCINQDSCQKCGDNFQLKDNYCLCKAGYYLQGEQCVPCAKGCLSCLSETNCLQCKEQFDLIDGMCLCKNGTYPDELTCLNCIRGCQKCQNGNQCQVCKQKQHYIKDANNICICDATQHFVDDGKSCVCMRGYYIQTDTCQRCPLGCAACSSSTQCQQCNEGLEIKDGVCKCIKSGQFIDHDGVCQPCNIFIPFCAECINGQVCTACQPDTNREIKQGRCQCKQGFFPDHDQICQPCNIIGCLQCQSLEVCKNCDSERYFQKDIKTGLCKCMKNYSLFQQICVKCQPGCLDCDPNQCFQCDTANHWILDWNQCTCQKSYFAQNDVCLKCMTGCLNCVSKDYCDQCDAANHFISNKGMCVCQTGFYFENQICTSCSVIQNCIQCINAGQCTKCHEPFILNTTSHKCTCPNGKFVDGSKCTDCPQQCSTCTSLKNCTSCKQGYVLKDGACKKKSNTNQMIWIIVGVMALATIIFQLLK